MDGTITERDDKSSTVLIEKKGEDEFIFYEFCVLEFSSGECSAAAVCDSSAF
jgi:hypothetical protein